MKNDTLIKEDVDAKLRSNPEVDTTDIAPEVHGGVVALSGRKSTDPEIARAALAALKSELPATWQSVKPIVHAGRVLRVRV